MVSNPGRQAHNQARCAGTIPPDTSRRIVRWSHGHVMLCVTCLLKLLVSKAELGTRIA